jgi:multidrug resistance efflux pump
MGQGEQVTKDETKANVAALPVAPARARAKRKLRLLPILITLVAVAAAAVLTRKTWIVYMATPWTRDGTVRAYVVTIAPEVAGRIVELPIADNQFVHRGDPLMVIDPTNYAIALRQTQAAVDQAKAVAQNARQQATRRQKLSSIAISDEQRQIFTSQAASAAAAYEQTAANRDLAQVNLGRTRVTSPVNGYVTNLRVQVGDYVNIGELCVTVVNADSYWLDGYFEETNLRQIHEGDEAKIKLMGYSQVLTGHVAGFARAINVANAQPDSSGLASVNPIFTWVRLAQRVPVRIAIDKVPDGVRLVAGMTATIQIDSTRHVPAS